MKKTHNYKNLDIWRLGIEIANDISDILITFPKHELFGLGSQMSRSSVSMPSNIAEGSARSEKSFLVFLNYSLGSSFELETQLHIAKYRKYISAENSIQLEKKIAQWQKMTRGFQKRLEEEMRKEDRIKMQEKLEDQEPKN